MDDDVDMDAYRRTLGLSMQKSIMYPEGGLSDGRQ
jgi:hypothetical protein